MLLAITATALVLWAWLELALASPQLGWDFPVFYIAGSLPVRRLYDRAAFATFFLRHLSALGVPHWAAYVRPSIFSFPLRPLAALPYYRALWLWLGGGLFAYLASVALLIRKFRLPASLFPVYACFFPALLGIIGGADASFCFFVLVLSLVLLERKRDGLAAFPLTACLCKFNLVFLVPVLLLLHRRYRALAYFSIGAVLIATASLSLRPLSEYMKAVAAAQTKTPGFFPVGLRGFSAAIGQPWSYPILAAAALVLCCWLMRRLPFAEAFCVAIIGALLISPYVCWYDSTLLALPLAVVFARSETTVRAACIAVLIALPLWSHGGGNNGPIGFMHVGVELLLLAWFINFARPVRRQAPGPAYLEDAGSYSSN